jgi:hypothetical protein
MQGPTGDAHILNKTGVREVKAGAGAGCDEAALALRPLVVGKA